MKFIALVSGILLLMTGCAKHVADKQVPAAEVTAHEAEAVPKALEPVPAGIIPEGVITEAERKYGYFARKRYEAYNAKLYELQTCSTEAKLKGINDFFNRVPYENDLRVWGRQDYWATPLEFLGRDRGDCEDYVIAKYIALKDLGISSDKLYISYVKSLRLNERHMVLSYFPSPSSVPLILDNTNYKIFPADQRKDLKPIYNVNFDTCYIAGEDGQNIMKVDNSIKARERWDQVIHDVDRHKF